jgi:hypothetical protein
MRILAMRIATIALSGPDFCARPESNRLRRITAETGALLEVETSFQQRTRWRRRAVEGRSAGEPLASQGAATNPGFDEDTAGMLLNHAGRSATSRYIKTSYLGRMLAAAQDGISAHMVKALGAPRGLA